MAPTRTATRALLLVNGAMIETGSFRTPMPYAMQAMAIVQVAPIAAAKSTGRAPETYPPVQKRADQPDIATTLQTIAS